MKIVPRSLQIATLALFCWSAPLLAQPGSRVAIDQLSRPLGSASAVPPPVSASSREGTGSTALRPAGAAPEVVQACRDAGLRGTQIKGVDCAAILQQAEALASQLSGEGTLLEMFGRRGNVTGVGGNVPAAGVDADAVARQLSTGNAQGAGAAEVAARQRDAPPPNRPR
jgi:hypothetical protein